MPTYRGKVSIPEWIARDRPELIEKIIDQAWDDQIHKIIREMPVTEGLLLRNKMVHKVPNVPWEDVSTYYMDVEAISTPMRTEAVYVSPWFEMDRELGLIASHLKEQKTPVPVCRWCGSHAPDDKRGNCSACGGTR